MKLPTIVIALVLAILPVSTPVSMAGSFDGTWNVRRTSMNCRPKSVISIKIRGRKISGHYAGGTGRHNISGSISSNGSFKFLARSPKDRVNFRGRISGKSGKGRWNVSGKACNGGLTIR